MAEPEQAQLLALAADVNVTSRVLASTDHLAALLSAGRQHNPRGAELPELTEKALVGAVSAIVAGRLMNGESESLPELEPQLVELILIPYLGHERPREWRGRWHEHAGCLNPQGDTPALFPAGPATAVRSATGPSGASLVFRFGRFTAAAPGRQQGGRPCRSPMTTTVTEGYERGAERLLETVTAACEPDARRSRRPSAPSLALFAAERELGCLLTVRPFGGG